MAWGRDWMGRKLRGGDAYEGERHERTGNVTV